MLNKAASVMALLFLFAPPGLHAQQRPVYVGGGLAASYNIHSLNLPVYRGDTLCGVFSSASSITPTGNLLFETPLGNPTQSLWITPRLHLSGLGALITTPATDQAQARNPTDSSLVTVTQAYHLNATLVSLGADLFVKYPLTPRFFLMGGPSISYLLQQNTDLTEVISSPTDALFPNGSQARTVSTGQIVNSNSILATFSVGASLDVPLSQKVILAPELTVAVPINSIRTDYSWHVTTIALGAELKFDVTPEPKLIVLEPPPSPAVPLKSEITASVQISGVTIDSIGVEHETPDPEIRVEEFERHEAYPVLNYIFFGEDSSTIPARYVLFDSNSANTFHSDSLSGQSTLDIYHNELNILGSRLATDSTASIMLMGTNCESPEEAKDTAVALARARSVQRYLVNVWKIDSSRITLGSERLPQHPSATSTADGLAENRRVEITSNDPSLLDPLSIETIDRTMNPPTIRLRTTEASQIPLTENTLILSQGNRILTSYRGPGLMEQWHPTPEDLPRSDSPMVATLKLKDSIGGQLLATDTTKVNLVTIRKKREERTQDKIIEHYNLITFNFDRSDLDDRSLRVVSQITRSVTPGTRVLIRGYTDISGESVHNLELSQARAKAVEAALRQALGEKASSVSFETQGEGQADLVNNSLPEGRFLSRTVFVELQKPVQ